ncbi:hypothetical protein [Streptomyces sp. NPDC059080]|uniref:hypothetical protein n=1 Tax=Streptomyces sp. NPDC059080 TaxID=3346718 RepID=UPI00369DA2F1
MTSRLDDVLGALSREERLELVRRVRVGFLTLRDGDRVRAELRLAEGDVVRTDEQPSEYEREQDETLWHIPDGEILRSRCGRWIDRVGRPCPQLSNHEEPCGLPQRRR